MKNRAVSIAMDIARRAERALGGRMGYAEGGEVSDAKMARAISDRAMRGIEPTPEQKQYLANMQAMRDKRGDENLSALTSLGQNDIPMPDASMARKVSNRAMSGRDDFSPKEQQHLESSAPGKEERSVAPGLIGGIGAELTGVPSMLRGTGNMGKGVYEGDPYTAGGGALEALIGATPVVGKLGIPALKSVTSAMTGTVPRFAATSAAAGYLNTHNADAETGKRNSTQFIQDHPAVKSLIEKRAAAQAAMQDAEQKIVLENPAIQALQAQKKAVERELAKTNQQHARSGPETQRKALAPFEAEIARINGDIKAVGDRARQPFMDEISRINETLKGVETDAANEFKDQASFRDKYPGAPGAMMAGGLGLAAGWPILKEALSRRADNSWRIPAIDKATTNARDAFASGASDAETATAQAILRKKLDSWDKSHSPIESIWGMGSNTVKGAIAGGEASMLPEQLDYMLNEPGHPARQRAADLFNSPDYWSERKNPMLLGGSAGFLGSAAAKLPKQNKEFLTEAREIASRGNEPTFLDRAMSRVTTGKAAKGPTDDALERVRRYRTSAGPASPRTPPDEISASVGNTPPGASAPSQRPTAPPESTGANLPDANPPPKSQGLAERIRSQDLALGPVGTPNPLASPTPFENFKPSERIVPTGSTKSNDGGILDAINGLKLEKLTPIKGDLGRHPKGQWSSYAKQLEKAKKELIEKLSKEPDLYNRGGAVGRAMQIAKNAGGGVLTGPVTHRADGGRTDTVETHLPSMSYVVPADIVSSLGEGDTAAGYGVLENMFGPAHTKAEHGARPAIVAGGEYVLSPEQVAQIGNGNHELGFSALDSFVKMQRRKHIQQLKALPGPVVD